MMNYRLQKKLLHFESSGSVIEDFVASRKKKTAVFRRIVRVSFYVHCSAALLNILLAVLFKAGFASIPVIVCALGAAWLSFLSAANVRIMKTLLLIADVVFAAGGFVAGALLTPRAMYYICGASMCVCALAAAAAFMASVFREFLEGYSPLAIRREDYTLLKKSASALREIPKAEEEEEQPQPLPPLTSEMRELANQLKSILCGDDL